MRLVIQFQVGDRYTYSATETVPVIYESAEAFAVDFETFCLDNKDKYFSFDKLPNYERLFRSW